MIMLDGISVRHLYGVFEFGKGLGTLSLTFSATAETFPYTVIFVSGRVRSPGVCLLYAVFYVNILRRRTAGRSVLFW